MVEERPFDPRRRIVGAVVLVTVAVIFLPMVFKAPRPVAPGDDVLTVVRDTGGLRTRWQAPSAPAVTQKVVVPATPPAGPVAAPAAPPSPTARTMAVAASGKPATARAPAWVVQVGAYVNAGDAIAFTDRLKAQGFPAHMHLMSLAHGRGIVVTIGPYAGGAEAAQAASRVVRLDHIHGLIEPAPA